MALDDEDKDAVDDPTLSELTRELKTSWTNLDAAGWSPVEGVKSRELLKSSLTPRMNGELRMQAIAVTRELRASCLKDVASLRKLKTRRLGGGWEPHPVMMEKVVELLVDEGLLHLLLHLLGLKMKEEKND